MRGVEDEHGHSRNISPSDTSQVIESSDGSNDDQVETVGRKRPRVSSVIDVDDDSSEEVPVAEETDDAERGMTHESIDNHMLTLTQIASRKIGMHQSMHSSTLFHPLTMLETQLDVFMSLSAMQSLVRVKA